MAVIDKSAMRLVGEILDEDVIENQLLNARAIEAKDYLQSFRWCRRVERIWFAGGFSEVAVFFAEIDSNRYDSSLWILVGDIPPAHLTIDDIPDCKEALLSYVYHMRKWVEAALVGNPVDSLIPVNVESNLNNARLLESRLDFIENEYVPQFGS